MNLLNIFSKPIVMDFYTSRADVFEYAKPAPAAKFFPDWWKKLPLSNPLHLGEGSTMKRCAGFTDYYKKGLMLPLWSDLALRLGPIGSFDYEWAYSDATSDAQIHTEDQHTGFAPRTHYAQLKLVNPWIASCSHDIEWLFTQPAWNFEEYGSVLIPNGVVEFRNQHGLNINMLIPHGTQERRVNLSFGQPMVHLIPLTERKIEYRCHLVTHAEFMRIWDTTAITFTKTHRKKKALKACPFANKGTI